MNEVGWRYYRFHQKVCGRLTTSGEEYEEGDKSDLTGKSIESARRG
jgi:hypothetical protein